MHTGEQRRRIVAGFWGHICLLSPLSRLGTYSSSLTLALCIGTEYFYLKVGTDIFLAFPVPPKLQCRQYLLVHSLRNFPSPSALPVGILGHCSSRVQIEVKADSSGYSAGQEHVLMTELF